MLEFLLCCAQSLPPLPVQGLWAGTQASLERQAQQKIQRKRWIGRKTKLGASRKIDPGERIELYCKAGCLEQGQAQSCGPHKNLNDDYEVNG